MEGCEEGDDGGLLEEVDYCQQEPDVLWKNSSAQVPKSLVSHTMCTQGMHCRISANLQNPYHI